MSRTYAAPAKRVPNAQALADRRYARKLVQARKGRGSYTRKVRTQEHDR